MRSAPLLVCVAGLAVTLSGVCACDGQRVRLGDGPLPVPAPGAADGGPRGDAGNSGASNSGASNSGAGNSSAGNSGAGNSGAGNGGTGTADAGPADAGGANAGFSAVDASTPCERGQISAEEVLWIGDSWLMLPGNQRSEVEGFARAAGALGPSEQYVSLATAGASLQDVIGQYTARQQAGPPSRVLVMDGGTWDTLTTGGEPNTVADVTAGFERLLGDLAVGGVVEHVIYLLMPELPMIYGVAELRPGLVAACAASAVPCHFIDLQTIWQGYPDYTGPSGIQASESGASAIAKAIWDVMVQKCIAQ